MKIGILFANYGPYHIARVSAAVQLSQKFSHSVIGIELTRKEEEYPWETETAYLPFKLHSVTTEKVLEKIPHRELCSKLWQLLNHINPDTLVIAGYARPPMLAALCWSRLHHKKVILMSDSAERDFVRNPFQEMIKGWILKKFHAALVAGKPHIRYLKKLGLSSESIFLGYDVVDNDAFHPNRIQSLPSPLDTPYFLAINRFVPKKNIFFLIDAYARYRQIIGNSAWQLVLCGDGTLRPEIALQIEKLNLQEYVHLPGFLQQDALLPYLSNAGCFVHASTQEQWGLVVNEAMAAGLPVLLSNRCGCFEDLIIEGINGFGFDPTSLEELTELMKKVSSGFVDLDKFGKAALNHIQKFSPGYFAEGLMQAVEYTTAHH